MEEKRYKPIEDLKVGDTVYKVSEDGHVSKMTVTDIKPEEYFIYFLDSLYNQNCYGVIRRKKSYVRLSGTNESVYSTKEETKICLERKIKYIGKQIENLEKL